MSRRNHLKLHHLATHVTDMGIYQRIESWSMYISPLRLDKRQRRRIKRGVKAAIRENRCILSQPERNA